MLVVVVGLGGCVGDLRCVGCVCVLYVCGCGWVFMSCSCGGVDCFVGEVVFGCV